MSSGAGLEEEVSKILEEVGRVIVGKKEVLQQVMVAILADGHLLFEDYPGLAKTLTARCFASTLGCDFKRVQFTADLLPADITGGYVLDRKTSAFELRKGPVFCNILLADEINRAPPRTQSALLEAMQEHQVTIENKTLVLDSPFVVFATQNPIEYEGTYPLPEAQLDRFIMKVGIGYPTQSEEVEILERRAARQTEDVAVTQVTSRERVLEMRTKVERVHIDPEIERYIVEIVGRTRNHSAVEVGASPRGSLAMLKLSKANAWMHGRDYVLPDDVKAIAVPALSHRLILTADHWIRGTKPEAVVESVLVTVDVPKVG
ncbi:MAG: MoxR family ATPase [Nitrososphaerota archaeon]|nr:MoxR family ATPase [Nitrososphaerota archaeon]